MHTITRLAVAALSCVFPLSAAVAQTNLAPQYVIISFDGAQHVAQWQRSRALSRKTGAQFTYFLSCVYLLTRADRALYEPPRHTAGRSNVGYAESTDDVAQRLRQLWTARMEGHEIASHGCGHFDGGDWSAREWASEFRQFSQILSDAWELNGVPHQPPSWNTFVNTEITGFRAPYLSTGNGLFEALEADGFAYDASTVSRGPAMPKHGSVTHFSLPMIPEGPSGRPIIAMDYNLFVRHSGGLERGDPDGSFEARTRQAFTRALDEQLAGERLPLQIGFHFTLMNDGAYWRALEAFTEDACTREGVRCVSYRTYLKETAAKDG